MPAYSFDEILDLLQRHRQRATYGAIGAVLDRPPYYLMGGRPRDHRHSWVVSKESGLPTGYGREHMHPELEARDEILSTGDRLERWLRDPW
jgi:hypothetical protein